MVAAAAVVIGIVLAAGDPVADRLLHRHRVPPGQGRRPTSLTGPATVILSGLAVGFESAVYTALVIGAAVFGAALIGGADRACSRSLSPAAVC